MNKLTKKKLTAVWLESAAENLRIEARCTIRWDLKTYCDATEGFDAYDDDELEKHLNAKGREVMALAESLINEFADLI